MIASQVSQPFQADAGANRRIEIRSSLNGADECLEFCDKAESARVRLERPDLPSLTATRRRFLKVGASRLCQEFPKGIACPCHRHAPLRSLLKTAFAISTLPSERLAKETRGEVTQQKRQDAASTLVEVASSRFTSVPRALILSHVRGPCNRQTLFCVPVRRKRQDAASTFKNRAGRRRSSPQEMPVAFESRLCDDRSTHPVTTCLPGRRSRRGMHASRND